MKIAAEKTSFMLGKQRVAAEIGGGVFRPATTASQLDEESYGLLASVAHEISRELGGDGLLVTWHEDAGEPRHLFANGACESMSGTTHDIARMAETVANMGGGGARSHWRTFAEDPLSGLLTTSIPAERGVLTIATLFKHVGRSTRMTAGETAARLLPLLQPFFRTWLSRLRTATMVRALTTVIDDSDVGILLLDRSGQLILSNSVAAALMDRGDGLRRKGAGVAGTSITDTLRLHIAIETAVAPRATRRSRPAPVLVSLRRDTAAPLIVAVVANAEVGGDGADRGAIIYVVDPAQDLQPLIEPVCDFYRLSAGEARLACLLAGGASLAEAAAHVGVREQTARTYLKQIFLKTETNRQSDLVRLLLLSAVRAGHAVTPPK